MIVEKQFSDLPEAYRNRIPIPKNLYRAERTPSCPSGTKGRTAVFEFLSMDKELERLILKNPGENEIYKYARSRGYLSMKEDAMIKSFQGTIPFEEVNKL